MIRKCYINIFGNGIKHSKKYIKEVTWENSRTSHKKQTFLQCEING